MGESEENMDALVFEPGDSVSEAFWRLWKRLEVINSFVSDMFRAVADMMLARAVDEDDALYLIHSVQDLESSVDDVKQVVKEIVEKLGFKDI